MKKENITLIIIALVIVGIILIINYMTNAQSVDEKTMQCIANNSFLIVSKTCGHCANQEAILEEHLDKFELLYVEDDPTLFDKYNIRGVPAWIINDESYVGVRSIKQLKDLTGC